MKTIISLFFLSLLICAFQTNSTTYPIPKIKKTINLRTGNGSVYFYGKNGRLDSMINSSGTRTFYRYAGNMVVKELRTPVETGSSNIDTLLLNTAGLVEHVINYQNGIRFKEKYEYDNQRHLVRVIGYDINVAEIKHRI